MPASTPSAPDAGGESVLFRLMRKDHHDAEAQLAALAADAVPAERERCRERFAAAIEHHMAAEERVVYPALARIASLAPFIERMRAQHDAVRDAVATLNGLVPDASGFGDAVAEVRRLLMQHVTEEESALFEHAAEHLAGELEATALEFETARTTEQGAWGV